MSIKDFIEKSELPTPDTPLTPADIAALRRIEATKLQRNASDRLGRTAMFGTVNGTKAVIIGASAVHYNDMRSRDGFGPADLHIEGVRYLLPDQDEWSDLIPMQFGHREYAVMPGSISYTKETKSVIAVAAAEETTLKALRVALCYKGLHRPPFAKGEPLPTPEDRGEATETVSLVSSVQEVVPFGQYYSGEAFAGIPLLKLEAN